jgi:hypothetical protein
MNDAPELERLRKVWQQRTVEPDPTDQCPGSEKIWEALSGSLEESQLHAIVKHLSTCPHCAELWRLAHAMGAMPDEGAQVIRLGQRSSPRFRYLALAAGVVILIGLGMTFWWWHLDRTTGPARTAPAYRTDSAPAFKSLVPEDQPISRRSCRLSWTPGPQGTRYNVRVTTTDLIQIDLAEGLSYPEYWVPVGVLEELSPGTRLMWQVQAILPGGQRALSKTYFLTLE